jgi:hypothetical protein
MGSGQLKFLIIVWLSSPWLCDSLRADEPILAVKHYQDVVARRQHDIETWQLEAQLQIGLTACVLLFGAAIAVLQGSKKSWSKGITIAMGAAITVFTGVSAQLIPGDYKTLERSVVAANAVLREVDIMIREFDPHQTPENIRAFDINFVQKLNEIDAIQNRFLAVISLSIPTVNAQAGPPIPKWAANPPTDERSFYAAGTGSDTSLSRAEKLSLDNALDNLTKQLAAATNGDYAAVRDFIAKTSAIDNSTFAYDRGNGVYSYFTLLRVSKEARNVSFGVLPRPVLYLNSLTVKHDGAPGSTTWRFDVIVNGSTVGIVPEHKFSEKDRLVPINGSGGISWAPVALADAPSFDIQVVGHRPLSMKSSKGQAKVPFGPTASEAVAQVRVTNLSPLLGEFIFEVAVRR